MATPISNVPGSSRPAGTATPLDVILVDILGNPIEGTTQAASGLQPQLTDGQTATPSIDRSGNTRVTDPASQSTNDLLASILIELKTITYYLQTGLGVVDDAAQVRRDLDADSTIVQ